MNSVSTLVAQDSAGSHPRQYRHALASPGRRTPVASNQHLFRSPVHQAVATTGHAATHSALGANAANPMNATSSPGPHGIVAGLIMLVALAGVAGWMLKLLVQLWFG